MTNDQLFEEWDKTQVNNVLYVDYPNITAWLKAAFLAALRIGREMERKAFEEDGCRLCLPHRKPMREEIKRLSAISEKYSELLMEVGNKHHDETRHETALRYIRAAEAQQDMIAKSTNTLAAIRARGEEVRGDNKRTHLESNRYN